MPNYAARRPGTRCRACRNGRHRADPYPGDLGLGEKQLRPTFSDLATTMACWPVVLRSDALRTCVNRDRTWRGKTFTAAAIRRYQRCALSDSVALLAEGRVLVVFPEGYPNIDAHYTPKTRPEEFLSFKAGFATIAAAAEKRLGARVPIVPSGFRYTKNKRWTARLNIGEAVYLEDFLSRQLLLSYMEQRVPELSGLSTAGNHEQWFVQRLGW